jgi:hypothetical protein
MPKPEYCPRGEPLEEPDVQWLAQLVDRVGDVQAARCVGLSRETVYRALARRPLHHGSRCAIRDARREQPAA